MDSIIPEAYRTDPRWQTLAEGAAGQTLRSWASPAKLEAIIAGRRASCSAKMKALRSRSERNIAKLIGQRGL
jgi:hypothetical protein